MAITKRLRFEILRRDDFRCTYCGATPADGTELRVDHVIPVALGGTDDPSNLTTSCFDCDSGKTSSSPTEIQVRAVEAQDLVWRHQVGEALAQIRSEQTERATIVDQFEALWNAWTWTDRKGQRRTFDKAAGWRSSVGLMLDRGLSLEHLDMCITIAMEANPDDEWTYFCGVAWNTLRRAQEAD